MQRRAAAAVGPGIRPLVEQQAHDVGPAGQRRQVERRLAREAPGMGVGPRLQQAPYFIDTALKGGLVQRACTGVAPQECGGFGSAQRGHRAIRDVTGAADTQDAPRTQAPHTGRGAGIGAGIGYSGFTAACPLRRAGRNSRLSRGYRVGMGGLRALCCCPLLEKQR